MCHICGPNSKKSPGILTQKDSVACPLQTLQIPLSGWSASRCFPLRLYDFCRKASSALSNVSVLSAGPENLRDLL